MKHVIQLEDGDKVFKMPILKTFTIGYPNLQREVTANKGLGYCYRSLRQSY